MFATEMLNRVVASVLKQLHDTLDWARGRIGAAWATAQPHVPLLRASKADDSLPAETKVSRSRMV